MARALRPRRIQDRELPVHGGAPLPRLGRRARDLHGLPEAGRRCGSPCRRRRSCSSSRISAGRSRSCGGLDSVLAGAQVRRDRRRRRRLRDARVAAARRSRAVGRRAVEGVPDALAHGRGAGRHRRLARQHVRGQLALAHVRHDQGLRLARRPGRDRVHVQDGAAGRLRARALRDAVRPQPRRHDLPAAVRRPHGELRREAGAARVRRRRPHRPRAAAHALPAQRPRAHAVLRRVDGARPRPRRRRRRAGRRRAGDGDRRGHDPAGEGDDARDRRRRPHLRRVAQRVHQHRRRPRHGGARRHSAAGHGVLAVPPDGRRRAPAC